MDLLHLSRHKVKRSRIIAASLRGMCLKNREYFIDVSKFQKMTNVAVKSLEWHIEYNDNCLHQTRHTMSTWSCQQYYRAQEINRDLMYWNCPNEEDLRLNLSFGIDEFLVLPE